MRAGGRGRGGGGGFGGGRPRSRPPPPPPPSPAGICFSFSDYHPETWNPVWTIESILVGLRSFMVDTERTAGGIETDDFAKRKFAAASKAANAADPAFVALFGAGFAFPA